MLDRMKYVWRFNPETQEFDDVLPLMVRNDPGAYYVIRDGFGDLWVHDPWGRECHANFEYVEVCGMTFDRERFDPEGVDGQRTTKEPPTRSLYYSLTPEELDDLRTEMRRDGQLMKERLAVWGKKF